MRLLLFILLFIPFIAFSQGPTYGAAVGYVSGVPTYTPNTAQKGSELCVSINSKMLYLWNRDSSEWKPLGGIAVSFGVPSTAPAAASGTRTAINMQTGLVYWWNGTVWKEIIAYSVELARANLVDSLARTGWVSWVDLAQVVKDSINAGGSGGSPTGAAGGDLTGTYPNPVVDGLQGVSVSGTTPTSGQVLKHDGSAWAPGKDNTDAYLTQSSAPSDTLVTWLDNSSGATNIWERKKYIKGGWKNIGYYDPIGGGYSNLPPVYVAATGQSNMQGYLATGGDTTRSTRVVVWNGSAWRISTIGQLPYYPPADNNLAFQFCKNLAETENRIVRLVMEVAGGTEIEQWEGASKARYDALETKITNSGMPRVDVILWHQGESNGDGLPSVCHDDDCYRTLLYSVIAQFRAETWGRNALFIAGGLATSLPSTYAGRESVLEELSNDTLVYTGWVDSYGLTTNVDSVHFTGVAQQEFGRRYYNAYKALPTLYGVRTTATQATDSTIVNVTYFADTSAVTWTPLAASDSGSGTLTSGGTLPAGGNGLPTIDATRDFIYRIQWSASLATNDAAVIILDDSLNTNVTWIGGGSLAFPAGFYVGLGVLYGTVNNSSFLATGYSPTVNHYARLTKSGNNILLQTSPDDVTYTTRYTFTNALVGKTTLYPKVIFAASGAKVVKEATVLQEQLNTASQYLNFTNAKIYTGAGNPEGAVTAVVGSVFMRSDGGAGTTLYVKQSGSSNTGWVAYSATATGAAGGDLTGTYPNPVVGNDKIISAYVLNGTLVNADLASQTLDSTKMKNRAITLLKIAQSGAANGQVAKYNSTTGNWEPGADNNTATNLGYTDDAITGTVTSSTGSSTTLPAATDLIAGLLTASDYVALQALKNTRVGLVSGTTDGSGDLVITFSSALPNATYSIVITPEGTTSMEYSITAKTTTTATVRFYGSTTGLALASTAVTVNYNAKDY